jgi:hypothetical protein
VRRRPVVDVVQKTIHDSTRKTVCSEQATTRKQRIECLECTSAEPARYPVRLHNLDAAAVTVPVADPITRCVIDRCGCCRCRTEYLPSNIEEDLVNPTSSEHLVQMNNQALGSATTDHEVQCTSTTVTCSEHDLPLAVESTGLKCHWIEEKIILRIPRVQLSKAPCSRLLEVGSCVRTKCSPCDPPCCLEACSCDPADCK